MVGVNVVFEGQRCADELILGMSRGAWRQRSRVHWCSGGRGVALENGFLSADLHKKLNFQPRFLKNEPSVQSSSVFI